MNRREFIKSAVLGTSSVIALGAMASVAPSASASPFASTGLRRDALSGSIPATPSFPLPTGNYSMGTVIATSASTITVSTDSNVATVYALPPGTHCWRMGLTTVDKVAVGDTARVVWNDVAGTPTICQIYCNLVQNRGLLSTVEDGSFSLVGQRDNALHSYAITSATQLTLSPGTELTPGTFAYVLGYRDPVTQQLTATSVTLAVTQ